MKCGLIRKIDDIRNKFLKKKDGYRFGIIDTIEEFLFTSRSVGVMIDNEEFKNGQRYISLSYYFSENNIKNGILDFREKVREFIEFLNDEESSMFDSSSFSTKIEYGDIVDETKRISIRTAIIKKTYKITTLISEINSEDYKKMSENIYLKQEKEE